LFVLFLSSQIGFLISETDSLPAHYFLHMKEINPKIGHYTVVWNDWYSKKVIKKVLGKSGDKIWYHNNGTLFVNNIAVGVPKTQSRDGRVLTPISAQIIPEGYVFLYAEHVRSFDSRYQEFGLVALSQLQGRVFPLSQ
jgi:conjugal transfer pilin signal peptidase TrbI